MPVGKGDPVKMQKKQTYMAKLIQLLDEYPKLLIVSADNIGSSHLQEIRSSLRGKAVLLMGKNTMIRKAIRGHIQRNQRLEELLRHVKGNIGFVFTKGDLNAVKDKILELKVEAPAKVGTIAPNDVTVFAGPTGLDPTQTTFLQALNIASKINKSQIEVMSDHLLIKKGDKVGQSESTLLTKLNIKPFRYSLNVTAVYDEGYMYDPAILELKDEDILDKFLTGVRNVAALGLALSFPTTASLPHVLVNGFKNVVAIALETGFTFPQAEKVKAILANPGAGGGAGGAPAGGAGAKGGKDAGAKDAGKGKPAEEKPKPKPEPEPEPEEEADMGFGLFD